MGGLASYLAYRLLRRAARRWLGLGRGLGLLAGVGAAAAAGGGGHMQQSHLAYGSYPALTGAAAGGAGGMSDAALEQAFRMSSSSGGGRGYGAYSSSAGMGPYSTRRI